MTESEAKTKWCPLVRVLLPIHQAGNRISTFHLTLSDKRDREHYEQQKNDCLCIASACMFCRFDEKYDVKFPSILRNGHCGAASKPEFE